MDVVFLSPSYPPEMAQFTRGLAEVGARVHGVGDTPYAGLPESLRRHLSSYLHVPDMGDAAGVRSRVLGWLDGRRPDRIEAAWEPVMTLAARLRADRGLSGMSEDAVIGFRDKPTMRGRVAAAGLRVPRSVRVRTRAEAHAAAAAMGFPVVLKPVDGAGSADTFRCDDPSELTAALHASAHVPEASVEEFITGEELTYETLCIDGVPVYESVCRYEPSALVARKNEWISPIIQSFRSVDDPWVADGVALGRHVLKALGMGTGFTHMEWFRLPSGEPVFGEIACRPPGANMVDLMNYSDDGDLFREWARVVCHRRFEGVRQRPWSAAIVFKRAVGQGRIRAYEGLDSFLARHHAHVARIDLLPPGAPRRDWRQTFLSDGNLVVRTPDMGATIDLAREAAAAITLRAG